jgi:formylglycine-generating enzyme required for sulfatase activity
LPSEAEWEKAARWQYSAERRGQVKGEALIYPWGNTFNKNCCNTSLWEIRDTTPVGKYSPQGDSPYGCADMSGNVWEWTHSLFKPYPYQLKDEREAEKFNNNRTLRGGSWAYNTNGARCAYRFSLPHYAYGDAGGFRVAIAPAFS